MNDVIVSELNQLANEINEAHQEVNNSFKYTLTYAIYAGEKLLEAKEKCGHGNWLTWQEEHIRHDERTSRRYMNLAMNKQLIMANRTKMSDMTMDSALKLISPKPIIPESTGNEWWTPTEYVESVREVMNEIDLDPASCEEANEIVQATEFYTVDDDSLNQSWKGRIFINPPYSDNKPFAEKMLEEFESGNVSEAVILVGAHAIETQWFAPYWDYVLCFTGHRIKFDTPMGKAVAGNIAGSVFIYLGSNQEKFAEEFQQYGFVVKRWP